MKKIFFAILIFSLFILSTNFILANVCCEKTTDGKWCQNAEERKACDSDYRASPNKCEDSNFCSLGCCIDNEEGLCDKRAVEEECKNSGGIWKEGEFCEVAECKEGCCVIGEEKEFRTQKRCSFFSLRRGTEGNINWDIPESECRAYSSELGACVVGEKCALKTEEECRSIGGNYNLKKLCSNPDLETSCEKQSYIGCADGKDEIYWFDSCGNMENIYSSNKQDSWNNGIILSKEDSCNSQLGNVNSKTCGNCDKDFGSICSASKGETVKDGNYICKSIGCDENSDGINERKNGESWCAYDSYVGESNDFIGSTHWRRTCVEGKIEVENCGDRRNMICAEKEIDDFSVAQCRINLGISCYGKNVEECKTIPDCVLKNVDVDDYFNFTACVPKYPFGFDLNSDDNIENGKEICGLATQTCKVVYQKEINPFSVFKWKCIANCDCTKTEFAEKMNDLCVSVGDCGGYLNLEGDYSKNFKIDGKEYGGSKDLEDYIRNKYKIYLEKKNSESPKYIITSDEDASYLDEGLIEEIKIPDFKMNYWDELHQDTVFAWNTGIMFEYHAASMFALIKGVLHWAGLGDTKKEEITFTCFPTQPPLGGKNCEKCGDDLLKPCSKYQCRSLGQSCELLNEEFENPICINKYSDDSSPPKITPAEIFNQGYDFESISESGAEIKKCIPEYTLLNFSIKTNEYSQCHADFKPAPSPPEYVSMEYLPSELNSFSLTHNFQIDIPSIKSNCVDSENSAIYIVCNDYQGNFNVNEYTLDFCIEQGMDISSPRIIRTEPAGGSFLPYGTTENNFEIYLNEPSECSYSLSNNSGYGLMSGMICDLDDSKCDQEYSCFSLIENLTDENDLYVVCNDLANNAKDYNYKLYVTENKLKIDSIFPSEGMVIDSPGSIDLKVKTSGGINNGVSSCSYKFEEEGWSDLFTKTDSANHEYKFNQLEKGHYSILIECKDAVGNTATNYTQFDVNLDLEPPRVIRLYTEKDLLKIITDEESSCYYDTKDCNFNIEEKDFKFLMTTAFSKNHFYLLCQMQRYPRKCKFKLRDYHKDWKFLK